MVCAGWFRFTDPGSLHEPGLLFFRLLELVQRIRSPRSVALCLEQRPCGQMQREGPTKPKPIAKVTYFFALLCFACAISSCIIRQRLQQSAEAAIASALQTTEQGREDAAAGWVDLTYPYPCSYPILCSRTWSSSSQRGQSTGTKLRLTKLRLTTKRQ